MFHDRSRHSDLPNTKHQASGLAECLTPLVVSGTQPSRIPDTPAKYLIWLDVSSSNLCVTLPHEPYPRCHTRSSSVQRLFTFTTSPSTRPSPSLRYHLHSSPPPHFLFSSSSFRLHSIRASSQNNLAFHTPSTPNPNLVHRRHCLFLHLLPQHTPSFFTSHRNAWLAEEKCLRHQIDATTEEIAHLVELDDRGKAFLGTIMALIQSLQHPNETTMTKTKKDITERAMMLEETTLIDYIMEAASRSHFSSLRLDG
ncbi:hypothetical protein JHK85_036253 [Glycine max]|nr:hypothetical protein JHK85_036253 [Glycine max]